MRSLGEFVGHIVRAVKTDPGAPARPGAGKDRVEVRREVAEERRDTELGPVTLRRTTIEEIEIERPKEGI